MPDFKKQLFIQSAIVLAIVVILGGGIWYFYFSINKNLQGIMAVRSQIARRRGDLEALVQLRKEASLANVFSPQLEAKLPPKDGLFAFSKMLEQLAKSRGLQFGFSFGSETMGGEDAPSFVPFQVTTGGDSWAIIEFLADVQKGQYIVDISEVDLASSHARISGRVFYKE